MAEKSTFGQTFGGMMGCLTALALFGLLGIGGCLVAAGGCTYVASETAKSAREAVDEAKARAEAEANEQAQEFEPDADSAEAGEADTTIGEES